MARFAFTSNPSDAQVPDRGLEPSRLALQAGTLMLWLFCTMVGLIGLCFDSNESAPKEPRKELVAKPHRVERIQIELSDPQPAAISQSPAAESVTKTQLEEHISQSAVPAPIQPLASLDIPKLIDIASSQPAVFSVPSAPTPVPGSLAANSPTPRSRSDSGALAEANSNPRFETLVFGKGEGRQPPPDYPKTALRLRQEGSVIVRFSVNGQGKVTQASVSKASPWPLLNEAAVRCVRERWRFDAGVMRVYEVSIRFELGVNPNSPAPIPQS